MRLGFSVEGVRRTTMRDFIAYTDIAYADGGEEGDEPTARQATQADIDRFLS